MNTVYLIGVLVQDIPQLTVKDGQRYPRCNPTEVVHHKYLTLSCI